MTGPSSPERLDVLVETLRAGERGKEALDELVDGLEALLAPLVSRYGVDALTEAYLLLSRPRKEPVRDLAGWLCRAVKARLAATHAQEGGWSMVRERPVGGVGELEVLEQRHRRIDEQAISPLTAFLVGGGALSDAWFEELEAALVQEAFWPRAIARECVDALVLYVDACTGQWCTGQLRHHLGMLPPGVRCEVARALLDARGYLALRAGGREASDALAAWLSHGGDMRLLWDGLGTLARAA